MRSLTHAAVSTQTNTHDRNDTLLYGPARRRDKRRWCVVCVPELSFCAISRRPRVCVYRGAAGALALSADRLSRNVLLSLSARFQLCQRKFAMHAVRARAPKIAFAFPDLQARSWMCVRVFSSAWMAWALSYARDSRLSRCAKAFKALGLRWCAKTTSHCSLNKYVYMYVCLFC